MKLAIIAAIGNNRVIGKNGKLPWHISDDLKRFKRLTTGHTVLMGRKTFESIGKPLPHRRNVVLSSKPIPTIETFTTLEEALHALDNEEKVFVIGGAQIYSQLLEQADELYLTLVDTEVDGDAFFPPFTQLISSHYRLVLEETHDGYRFVEYQRTS